MFVNCLVKPFTICLGVFAIFICLLVFLSEVLNMISPLFYGLNFSKILVVDCDYVKNISESTLLELTPGAFAHFTG